MECYLGEGIIILSVSELLLFLVKPYYFQFQLGTN